jgi:hypothetical protein
MKPLREHVERFESIVDIDACLLRTFHNLYLDFGLLNTRPTESLVTY